MSNIYQICVVLPHQPGANELLSLFMALDKLNRYYTHSVKDQVYRTIKSLTLDLL